MKDYAVQRQRQTFHHECNIDRQFFYEAAKRPRHDDSRFPSAAQWHGVWMRGFHALGTLAGSETGRRPGSQR